MRSLILAAAVVATATVSASASTIDIASGTLSVANGGLVQGQGGWTSATLTYEIDYNDVTESYFYYYNLSGLVPAKEISHVLVQVSDNFEEDDIRGGATANELDEFGDEGNSNPVIPHTINSLKFTPGDDEDLDYSWVIETLRAPMWGNFYAKDGKLGGGPKSFGLHLQHGLRHHSELLQGPASMTSRRAPVSHSFRTQSKRLSVRGLRAHT